MTTNMTPSALRRAALLITQLRKYANPANVAGMARFGINPQKTLGVSMPLIRAMARTAGKDHPLALALWRSRIHEARILATMLADPLQMRRSDLERWVREFDSWDVCDQCCANLIEDMPSAYGLAVTWSRRRDEFVRRAGYVLMARLAVSDKRARDTQFTTFLRVIAGAANDERTYVKKAVNWALRQIGKRNLRLHAQAIRVARDLRRQRSPAARWIAADALRELTSVAVVGRLSRAHASRA
jgi:3-methyladenine DNA glycosylase AlkD